MTKFFLSLTFSLLTAFIAQIPAAEASVYNSDYKWQVRSYNEPALQGAQNYWENFLRTLRGQKPTQQANLKVLVKDAKTGLPLTNASVLAGIEPGVPFQGNNISSDSEGAAYFTHESARDNQLPITAWKEGYSHVSIFTQHSNVVEVFLEPYQDENAFSFMEGKLLGFPPGYGSRTLEVGLFAPSLRPDTLLNFDPQQIISSYRVEIDVYGKRRIPGNVVLPAQDKSYFFFTVHLEKPEFIMPIANGTTAMMAGAVGAVPVGDAIDLMRNNDFLGILNITNLTHVNWTEKMTINNSIRFDLTANQALAPKALQANYKNLPKDLDVVSVSLIDPAGDKENFIPMDVKSIKSEDVYNGVGKLKLGKLAQVRPTDSLYVFTSIFDRNQFSRENPRTKHNFSSVLRKVENTEPYAKTTDSKFLKIMDIASVSSDRRQFNFTSANNPDQGISANLILVSLFAEHDNALTQGKTRKLIWSSVLPGSATQLNLPPVDTINEEKLSLEIVSISSPSALADDGNINIQSIIKNMEYVSSVVDKL